MNKKEKYNYLQKCFEILVDKDFRKIILLEYIDSDEDFNKFSESLIDVLGPKSESFIKLCYVIAKNNDEFLNNR
jgi:hypothetical protein